MLHDGKYPCGGLRPCIHGAGKGEPPGREDPPGRRTEKQRANVQFLWNIDFSGFRIMTGVIRPSRRLVYRDKRGESSVPVLELHVLDQDGMSLAEHLYLGR